MLLKRITFGICIILLLTVGCGIFEPRSSTGTLNIVMVNNPQQNDQLNKLRENRSDIWTVMKVKLSNAHCIIKRDTEVEYMNPLQKEDDYFHGRIACLEPGENYSVFLYAKESRSYNIVVSAYKTGVMIQKGKEATIEMTWSLFMTTPDIPTLSDTVTGNEINFEWSPVVGAVAYQLIVDDNDDLTSPIIDTESTTNQISIPSESFQEGSYYWRVLCFGNWTVNVTNPSDQSVGVIKSKQLTTREGIWSDISSFVYEK